MGRRNPRKWGILCGGRLVNIGRNLYDVLTRLRSLTGGRMIWADALSIVSPAPEDFQDHFGCSKLSCALCSHVMHNADYQTMGTRARLYSDSAFPFRISSINYHSRLAIALKRVQDQLSDTILRYSMTQNDAFTQYVRRTRNKPIRGDNYLQHRFYRMCLRLKVSKRCGREERGGGREEVMKLC